MTDMQNEKDVAMAKRVAAAVGAAGGRTFYVGGFVRDRLRGAENKDVDIEIHGVEPERLRGILSELGTVTTMGASFGIYGLKGYDLDIAMPRREDAVGRGHKDFEVYVDPHLGTLAAARRRDFTINALMQDVLTDEVVDHFGGQDDLNAGVIRHVDETTFVEDPLRVLRAAQFAARFGYTVDPSTVELCSRMDLDALPCERVMGELEKALLKAAAPSVFFRELRRMGQLGVWFPEVAALIDVPQNPVHHPEGDVWEHTMMVLDRAAELRGQAREALPFMMAALCHDLGKPATTAEVDGVLRSLGHEKEGVGVATALVKRLSNERDLKRYVANMVEHHMAPNMLQAQGSRQRSYNRLFDATLCPSDLLLLAQADATGRRGPGFDADYEKTARELREHLARFEELMALPHVTGADLIAMDVKPGPQMGEILAFAHKLRLSCVSRDEALRQCAALVRKAQAPEG